MIDQPKPRGGLTIALMVALTVVGAGFAMWGGALLHNATSSPVTKLPDTDRLPVVLILLGIIMAISGVLVCFQLYSGHRVSIAQLPRRGEALAFGLVSGALALAVATLVEQAVAKLPGPLGSGDLNNALAGPIEEAAKLLLPVVLLIFVVRARDPRFGFWMVLTAATVFGAFEGMGYVFADLLKVLEPGSTLLDHVAAMGFGTVNRALSELMHPVITGAAAAMIWIAAATGPRGRAIGIGVLAYLVAAVLHGFNDGVIAGPITAINGFLAVAVSSVYILLIYIFWMRPQYARLTQAG